MRAALAAETLQPARVAFRAMGCPCELQLFARARAQAPRALARAREEIERLEARYSRYRDDSIVSEINRVAHDGGRIALDAETATLFDYAAACFEQSGGRFDITSGILRRAWRFDGGALPSREEIAPLLDRVGFDRLRIRGGELSFATRGMEIDLGGVVKEYAVDRVVRLLADEGSAMVNLGGDIAVAGAHPDGSAWRIGIRHPRAKAEMLATIELAEGALATSGDYERCIEVEGRRYGHILDPRSGWPVAHLASVSVVADLCTVAGSVATLGMLAERDGPAWLRASGLAHLWVDVDGAIGGSLAPAREHQRDGGR